MKKLIIILSVIILLTFVVSVFADKQECAENKEFKITVANEFIEFDNPTYVINDRIYVPLRDICTEMDIPIEWYSQSKTANLDIYNKKTPISDKTEYKEDGIIPDEETAISIGRIILERYSGESMEYETDDEIYSLDCYYDEKSNSWTVWQCCELKKGGWAAGGGYINMFLPNVTLNKYTAEILSLNLPRK